MGRFRFSIAGLLGLVTFCGVAAAALRASSEGWDSAVFGGALLILSCAVLKAAHARGSTRAYWLGFALFGGIYLGASLIPPVAARLPTTKGLAWLDARRPRGGMTVLDFDRDGQLDVILVNGSATLQGNVSGQVNPNGVQSWLAEVGRLTDPTTRLSAAPSRTWTFFGAGGTSEHFLGIGHALLALIFAALGAALSRRMADRPTVTDGAPS